MMDVCSWEGLRRLMWEGATHATAEGDLRVDETSQGFASPK
jgi:hypothetical protein